MLVSQHVRGVSFFDKALGDKTLRVSEKTHLYSSDVGTKGAQDALAPRLLQSALTVDPLWPGAVLDVCRAIGLVRDLGPLLNLDAWHPASRSRPGESR